MHIAIVFIGLSLLFVVPFVITSIEEIKRARIETEFWDEETKKIKIRRKGIDE